MPVEPLPRKVQHSKGEEAGETFRRAVHVATKSLEEEGVHFNQKEGWRHVERGWRRASYAIAGAESKSDECAGRGELLSFAVLSALKLDRIFSGQGVRKSPDTVHWQLAATKILELF